MREPLTKDKIITLWRSRDLKNGTTKFKVFFDGKLSEPTKEVYLSSDVVSAVRLLREKIKHLFAVEYTGGLSNEEFRGYEKAVYDASKVISEVFVGVDTQSGCELETTGNRTSVTKYLRPTPTGVSPSQEPPNTLIENEDVRK